MLTREALEKARYGRQPLFKYCIKRDLMVIRPVRIHASPSGGSEGNRVGIPDSTRCCECPIIATEESFHPSMD